MKAEDGDEVLGRTGGNPCPLLSPPGVSWLSHFLDFVFSWDAHASAGQTLTGRRSQFLPPAGVSHLAE